MTRIEGGVRSSQQIILDEEFRSLLVPHSDAESCELTESLLHYGCRDALTAWRADGSEMPLLDGYKRYDICTERGIDFRVQPIDLPSREHARLWIESNQLGRRSLTDDVRSVLALSVMERRSKLEMQERAREAGKAGGRGRPKEDSSKDTRSDKLSKKEKPKKNTRAAVAKQAKLPERKLRAIQELKKRAIAVLGEEKAEKLLLQIRHSELSIAKAKRILNKVEAEAKLRAAMAAPVPATEAVDLRVCSMQDLLESVENIDAIITDPPYSKEYLGLYGELARLAAKALKPGGILAVMCGQSYLPELLADMSKHMKYRWTIAYLISCDQAFTL